MPTIFRRHPRPLAAFAALLACATFAGAVPSRVAAPCVAAPCVAAPCAAAPCVAAPCLPAPGVAGFPEPPTTHRSAPPQEVPAATPTADDPAAALGFETVTFPSLDGLTLTADLYVGALTAGERRATRPFVVLFHQAGWSRGEYREIAPQLVLLGFDCLALDQRAGGAVGGVPNATHARAAAAKKRTGYVDAEQDLVAALRWARRAHADGRTLVAWGSSYSAALVLRVAADHPDLVDAWLAFSPGEYFASAGRPRDWIATAALEVEQPGFVTSARRERGDWEELWDNLASVPGEGRWYFLPETEGNHGSRALWARFADSAAYWRAVEPFLEHVRGLPRPQPRPDDRAAPEADGGDRDR